jgi:hypothetical protein
MKLAMMLCGAAFAAAPFLSSPAPNAARGPGAVEAALRELVAAAESGDREALQAAVAPDHGEPEFRDAYDPRLLWDEAGGDTVAVEGFGPLVDALGDTGRRFHTKVARVRANCASGECSYAYADLVRTPVGQDGGAAATYRLTALFRYEEDAAEGAPSWQLLHWHASATSGARPARPK